ncbi:MAG: GAF domain-containing protein [Leptolyngbyaceae cyanobacterium bins.59]|nr:GAF domain-containing protein [Leptolyngbyaceae cyanobacterium bins.59]
MPSDSLPDSSPEIFSDSWLEGTQRGYRTLVTSPAGIFHLTANGYCAYVSNRWCEMAGMSGNQAEGQGWVKALHTEDRKQFLQTLQQAAAERSSFESEFRLQHPDGSIVWVTGQAVAEQDDEGTVTGYILSITDITERKAIEEKLRQYSHHLEEVVRERTAELTQTNEQLQQEIAERKQAEHILCLQAERERLVAAISQRIHQSLNLTEILTTVVAEVRQFLQTDRVVIYQFAADWQGEVVVESVAPDWRSILYETMADPCFQQEFVERYRQGWVNAISDVYQEHRQGCHREALRELQIRASLVVPILQGETLWGLLIAHQCHAPRSWQSWESEALTQLALQLGIAIQQSELYHEVQRLNTVLEQQVIERTAQVQQALNFEAMLKHITDQVRDSLDENQILQTAVRQLVRVSGIRHGAATVYGLESETAMVRYECNTGGAVTQSQATAIGAFPEIYQQLAESQYFQFCIRHPDPSMTGIDQNAAQLACPIVDDQGVLGDLWLTRSREESFSELEIRLVQQVANQCAIGIRQARLYRAAQAQVEELEKLNHLKDDFLNTVSHELRTPLSSMNMAVQMLETILFPQENRVVEEPITPGSLVLPPPVFQKLTRYFRILTNECQREVTLINNLLDLSRLEVGNQPLVLMTLAPQPWIIKVAEVFSERIRSQEQQLQIQLPDRLPPLTTDFNYLERIVTELLNNACKYTPAQGTITLQGEILDDQDQTRSPAPKTPQLRLSIINTGIEIPAHELNQIFEKFYRIPNHDPWKRGGTGLGLALVKRLAAHLGATITVESEAGEMRFHLTLPFVP